MATARDPSPDSVSGMKLIAVIVRILFQVTIFASALGSEDANELELTKKDGFLPGHTTYLKPYENSYPNDYHGADNLQPITGHSKKIIVSRTKFTEVIKISFSIASLVISLILMKDSVYLIVPQ